MEGLGLTGVLARLPPVWSRTIQIPEHTAAAERGSDGETGEGVGLVGRGQRLANRAIEAKA